MSDQCNCNCCRIWFKENAKLKEEVALLNALVEAEKCGATLLFDKNEKLLAYIAVLEGDVSRETTQSQTEPS